MYAPDLVPFSEVMQTTGLPRRTFYERLRRKEIPIYVDGRDLRRRLIAKEDIPKLIEVRMVEDSNESAA